MSVEYKINGTVLHHLLVDNFKYETLCLYGEDEYCRGIKIEMARAMTNLPWNEGRSIDDMMKILDEEEYDVEDLIQDQINVFWEADKIKPVEGEWLTDTEYYDDDYSECNVRKVFVCSRCGRTERRKEPYCHCGAKMKGNNNG